MVPTSSLIVSPKDVLGPHEYRIGTAKHCGPRPPLSPHEAMDLGQGSPSHVFHVCCCPVGCQGFPRTPVRKSMVKRKHDIAQNFVWWNGSSCQLVFTIVFFTAHSLGSPLRTARVNKNRTSHITVFGGTAHPTKCVFSICFSSQHAVVWAESCTEHRAKQAENPTQFSQFC